MRISAVTEDTPSISSRAPSSVLTSTNRLKPVEVVQDKFNVFLVFKDPSDEALYRNSLKELFNFQTFFPVFIVKFVSIIFHWNATTEDINSHTHDDFAFEIGFNIFQLIALVATIIFTVAQFTFYIKKRVPSRAVQLSKYILRKFLNGHIEDLIILCFALSNGFKLLITVSGTDCAAPGSMTDISNCSHRTSFFPQHQLFGYFTQELILMIFLKCRDRFVSISSIVVLTIFMIIAIPYGKYPLDVQSCITAFVFLLAIYEFERFQLLSFLLTKEALFAEKSTIEQTKRDAADQLERRTNQALLQQILPAQVAKQLLSGKQVEPEKFEEVTIFFSDVVGFTDICAQVPPIKVVKMLNELYTVMDYCTAQFPLYKVETIGDAYMVRVTSYIYAASIMARILCSIVGGRTADKRLEACAANSRFCSASEISGPSCQVSRRWALYQYTHRHAQWSSDGRSGRQLDASLLLVRRYGQYSESHGKQW